MPPVLPRQAVEPLDRRVQQLGIGREGDGLRLHGSIDRDSLEVLAAQRAGLVRRSEPKAQRGGELPSHFFRRCIIVAAAIASSEISPRFFERRAPV